MVIFVYHRVSPEKGNSPVANICPKEFEKQIRYLKENFKIYSLYPFYLRYYVLVMFSLFGSRCFLWSLNMIRYLKNRILKFLNKNRVIMQADS